MQRFSRSFATSEKSLRTAFDKLEGDVRVDMEAGELADRPPPLTIQSRLPDTTKGRHEKLVSLKLLTGTVELVQLPNTRHCIKSNIGRYSIQFKVFLGKVETPFGDHNQ